MHPEMESIKCTIMRGGTSKGIFIMKNELPEDEVTRDKIIREVFGSPDVRQINGLGGADVLTSKLAIIGPATREDADVDYTFGQVSFVDEKIDYNSNCGNISAGVGPFAIDNGIVNAVEPVTTVRIHQVNTNTIITERVMVKDGKACVEGDFHIDGVPGTGSPIEIDMSDSKGAVTGKLLPTGNVCDTVKTEDGKEYRVSIVDAAIPVVFIKASDIGIEGTETPKQIESDLELMKKIEEIRGKCAQIMGLTSEWQNAAKESPYSPFFAIVSPPADYHAYNGKDVKSEEIHIVSRLLFMQMMHKTHPVTGTVCMGVAARIPGSIVNEVLRKDGSGRTIKIGHPAGIIPVISEVEVTDSCYEIKNISVIRTARMIMEGNVYIRKSLIK